MGRVCALLWRRLPFGPAFPQGGLESGVFFGGKMQGPGETFREAAPRRGGGFLRRDYPDKVTAFHIPQKVEGA
jgi:hypothetical protein